MARTRTRAAITTIIRIRTRIWSVKLATTTRIETARRAPRVVRAMIHLEIN